MNAKALYENYQNNKIEFHHYIDKIKKSAKNDIFTIVNTTLVKNPYASNFPKKYFSQDFNLLNKTPVFFFSLLKFYAKNIYLLLSYITATIIFKMIYKKKKDSNPCNMLIDVFFLIDQIKKDQKLNENYFFGLYEVLEEEKIDYCLLPRLYGVSRNPFKLIGLLKILNTDEKNYLFEFELLRRRDLYELVLMILYYPFKTLRLLQKENDQIDKIFNQSLLQDISTVSIDSFTRFILGKNIAKHSEVNEILSWSEFQVIERGFNYGIRTNNENIKLKACQFYLNYETYFNTYVDDLDYEQKASPHEVLVNGSYYVLNREKVVYKEGVSLRYGKIFDFKGTQVEENIVLLGSYVESETKYMLESVQDFENIVFKNHPAVDVRNLGALSENIILSDDNIYSLFENSKVVVSTASGTAVEAVVCGVSVIIMASQDNLTANPLVSYGQGEIWDIAFSADEVEIVYNKLLKFRSRNIARIKEISLWYKESFFIEPTRKNIIKAFELDIRKA